MTTSRQERALKLATQLIEETRRVMTSKEHKRESLMARMMEDSKGKSFITAMTDQCFRSNSDKRTADQLLYLIKKFGIPSFLHESDRMKFLIFRLFGNLFPGFFVPMIKKGIRKEMSTVMLPEDSLTYLLKRKQEHVRININHLGEAILGEEEAERRLNLYLDDLKREEIDYVSIKASTLYSQIDMIGWETSLEVLSDRLRPLYRESGKFVNLDMEEYKDLDLTVTLFKRVLSEPEFHKLHAGIVLQAYLPDAFAVQKDLTQWAQERVRMGGAPIKIRITKGANFAMERVESSLQGWEQAPFETKMETDANFKRMLAFGILPEHAKAVHLGVASHNLFDIAYALCLREEFQTEEMVSFEMLEGMAEPMRRVVGKHAGDILLYCPEAKEKDIQNAIAYLIRRLDENSGPQNFLRHLFELRPDNAAWKEQVEHFKETFQLIDSLPTTRRRTQNRFQPPLEKEDEEPFQNEPDTDFSLKENREWGIAIFKMRFEKPNITSESDIEGIVACAKQRRESWASEERSKILGRAAHLFRKKRDVLIGAMIADGKKAIREADPEVSEAIDFIEYYRKNWEKWCSLPDIEWSPKGTVLVASPWNFPCSIPVGGISAALTTGNCVIFKPAPETVLVGWHLVQLFWEAGVPKEVLQFLSCEDDPVGSALVKHPDVSTVILTGATETAKKLLNMRPGLDLHAETGGKNALIVTAMADRDLAIRDLVYSAFGHSGQKCSACSLAILEAEIYDDPNFQRQLRDAVQSLPVGLALNPASKITPLIRPPEGPLKRALTQLEEGETWLLEPKPDPENPHLWSPGIKMGVREGSFTHQTELFGPVLGVMRAESLEEAIRMANGTPYGLSSGLHSLDEREHIIWKKRIVAGNLYINRGITGAIVRRQPFGGHKASSFGPGAKAGGPNYLTQLAIPTQTALPHERAPLPATLVPFISALKGFGLNEQEIEIWKRSAESYAHWAEVLKEPTDPSSLLGQNNDFYHVPRNQAYLRAETYRLLSVLQVAAACLICGTPLEISSPTPLSIPNLQVVVEEEEMFLARLPTERIRVIGEPSKNLLQRAAEVGAILQANPVLANGRLELLHYLKEIALSIDTHRYGYEGFSFSRNL